LNIFSQHVGYVLDKLERDAKYDYLLEAIWDVIEFVTENPTDAFARRRSLRTAKGHTVWMVPIPVRHLGETWVLLWHIDGNDVRIPYVGPEDFRSDYI
jgi:hypothetical protein